MCIRGPPWWKPGRIRSGPLARTGITVRGEQMHRAPRSAARCGSYAGSFGVPACVVRSLRQALGRLACGKDACLSDWPALGDLLDAAAIVPLGV